MRTTFALLAIAAIAGCQGSSTAPPLSEQLSGSNPAESTPAASPIDAQPRTGSKATVGVSVLK